MNGTKRSVGSSYTRKSSKRRANDEPKCPVCGTGNPAPISYGLPALAPPEGIVLGGCCVVPGESPVLHCRNCGNRWGTVDEGPEDEYAKRVFARIREAIEKSGRSRTGGLRPGNVVSW